MATEKDAQIFVSGVTQYSMSSGKFAAGDILELARNAYAAFCDVFGKPGPNVEPQPRFAPAASQGPQRASPPAGGPDVPMETKSFSLWGGDKAYLFGDRDALWADWVDRAQAGDAAARASLEKAAKAGLGADPKWHASNAKRIARAKACLKMLADGQRATAPAPADWQPGDGDVPPPW